MASGAGFGALLGMGLGMLLLSVVIGIVVGTLILMLATKLVEKFTPSFVKALVVVIVCFVVVFIVHWILHMMLGFGMLRGLIVLAASFVVTAAIIQQLMTLPAGGKMAYGRACLITLVEYVIYIVLGIIFWVVVFTVFGGAMFAAMHH